MTLPRPHSSTPSNAERDNADHVHANGSDLATNAESAAAATTNGSQGRADQGVRDTHLATREAQIAPPSGRDLAARDTSARDAAARDATTRDVNWSDPQTRAVLDQIVVALQSDAGGGPPSRPTSARYGAILRRRWKPMLLAFAVGLALIAWRMKPDKDTYTAKAQMLLPPAPSAGASVGTALESLTGQRSTGASSSTETQIAVLTSPNMIKTALASMPSEVRTHGWAVTDTSEDANKQRTDMLKPGATAIWTAWWNPRWGIPNTIEIPVLAMDTVSTDVVDVTVTSQDPDASVMLANRVIKVYADRVAKQSNSSNTNSLEFVTGQLQRRTDELNDAKNSLRAYQEKVGITDVNQELSLITSRVSTLRDAANAAQDEVNAGVGSERVQQDSVLTALQNRTNELQANYENVTRTFRPSAPEAQAAEREYRNAKAQSDERRNALLDGVRERARNAQDAFNAARARADQLPRVKFDIGQLQAKIDELQTVVATLSSQRTTLDISRSATPTIPTNLSPAVAASVSARTWTRVGVMALVAGLMLAVLLAALLEGLDHSLHSADDVEAVPGANMLGSLPFIKGRKARNLGLLGDAAHAALDAPDLLELCRILRSNLSFASPDAPLHSVLVTSADAGEGKSLCACNLAAVMAFDGRRVLLLDGDLRRPTQHKLVGADLGFGWSDLINGGASLEDAVRATPTPNLSLLTAGTPTPNPTELLNSPRAREIFETLQERFDVIVVDSPPALALADAQLWASQCDATVLVAGANRTQRNRLLRAQSLLRHAGGNVVGIVLNRVKSRADLGMGGYGSEYAGANARFKMPAPALPTGRS